MKIGEILRQLADMIDTHQSDRAQTDDYSSDYESEEGDSGLTQQPDDVFVPPLQLKLELLKKATGVESIYDDGDDEEELNKHSYDDELAVIKRNAGFSVAALDALSDDEPLDV